MTLKVKSCESSPFCVLIAILVTGFPLVQLSLGLDNELESGSHHDAVFKAVQLVEEGQSPAAFTNISPK